MNSEIVSVFYCTVFFISLVSGNKTGFTEDLFTFTEKISKGELHF